MDFLHILDQLADGELDQYEVSPEDAFEFQQALRNYGRKQNIVGTAVRGGKIIYRGSES
ncbi:MAG: hypothetical protein Q3960_00500 [Lactobacillus sp.]|nr:hypothetical protein [Lactobacillus sp.]